MFISGRYLVLILLLTGLPCMTGNLAAQEIRVISFNIRYDNPNDGPNAWENRKEIVTETLTGYSPDIVGIQEALKHQVDAIGRYFGAAGDTGMIMNGNNEYCAILYNTGRLTPVKSGGFWLSETPGFRSSGWDASLERICTHLTLQVIETGTRILVINTHFDHLGNKAREQSARLIMDTLPYLNPEDLPVILTGDLNCLPGSGPISIISEELRDAHDISENPPGGPLGTFNGFDAGNVPETRIDYVFVSDDFTVTDYAVGNVIRNGVFVSDHFPVIADMELTDEQNKK